MTTMRFATACLAAAMALAAPVAQGAGLRIGLQSDPDALDPATGTSFVLLTSLPKNVSGELLLDPASDLISRA